MLICSENRFRNNYHINIYSVQSSNGSTSNREIAKSRDVRVVNDGEKPDEIREFIAYGCTLNVRTYDIVRSFLLSNSNLCEKPFSVFFSETPVFITCKRHGDLTTRTYYSLKHHGYLHDPGVFVTGIINPELFDRKRQNYTGPSAKKTYNWKKYFQFVPDVFPPVNHAFAD